MALVGLPMTNATVANADVSAENLAAVSGRGGSRQSTVTSKGDLSRPAMDSASLRIVS
jgi:hypothetical protein